MAWLKNAVLDVVGKVLFRELVVERALIVSPPFRRLDLVGGALRDARFAAGDKVQVILADGGARTFSPFGFDRARGAVSLLAHAHGDGPAARWATTAATGDRVRLFGPRGSLPLATLPGPVVLFGDETSFGVARALRESGAPATAIFEVTNQAHCRPALEHLELSDAAVVERRPDLSHLRDVEERVRAALAAAPGAALVLTGKAQSIQALRAALKARPAPHAVQKTKAYWSPGKRGLD